jgi:hypothetical protein
MDTLSLKLHLIREHQERRESIVSKMLEAAYLIFQTEVGVGSNILTQSYGSLGCLASHGFFKNLWQLLLRYSITLNLPSTSAIPLLWEEDQPFMDAIQATSIFQHQN